MNPSIAIQLMIGKTELAAFGAFGVLDRLAKAQEILDFGELYLAVDDPASSLSRLIVDRCRARGASVALWTMVMADAPRPGRPPALDAHLCSGYGRLGVWSGMGKGPEDFVFACPTVELEDDEGPELALRALAASGADALFLDRIRYPSPANGLEFLGACACPACQERYERDTGERMLDLCALAVREAVLGAAGAARFLAIAEPLLRFRASTIAAIVARYAAAARASQATVGLDLFAPSLAGLVGQDYAQLAPHADFIKAMLYCKSRGPACLPLELNCLVEGLVAAGVGRAPACAFVAGLTGLPTTEVTQALKPGGLPGARAAGEFKRAAAALGESGPNTPRLFAGIELVDQPDYGTRISAPERDEYLVALKGLPKAVCWNLLYIPEEHLAEVRANL